MKDIIDSQQIENLLELYFSKTKNQCRQNSLYHVFEIIEKEQPKNIIEFGTIRNQHEGLSTVLFSLLSAKHDLNFYSLDYSGKSLSISKRNVSAYYTSLLDYVNYLQQDQFKFIETTEDKFDFVYIDAMDKDVCLQKVLDHKMLNDSSFVLIDDMIKHPQTDRVIEVIKSNNSLTVIEAKKYFDHNLEEKKYGDPQDLFIGNIERYPTQILLKYN